MSHRFKRPKPLGNRKQNTKSVGSELPKILPTVPGLREEDVYDFLYIDRGRTSSLYAQLFPQGTLTTVKTTSQQSFSDDKNIGTDVKLFKAEAKSGESGSEGIEHVFDASYSIPLEVLSRLSDRGLIRRTLKDPRLGTIVLLRGFLRIIDYASMKDLWEPVMNLLIPDDKSGAQGIVGLIKSLPHTMHAHFITSAGFLWSSLRPTDLEIPSADIILKHGGTVAGEWNMLFVVDAYPDSGAPPNFENWSAGEATNGVLNVIHAFRMQIGRPANWFGVTPLMIYREIPSSDQGALGPEPAN